MEMEVTEVEPQEVIFREVLKRFELSAMFLVVIRDMTCVMQVVSILIRFLTVGLFSLTCSKGR